MLELVCGDAQVGVLWCVRIGYTMMLATAPDKCPMFAPLDEYAAALAYFERLQARPAFKRATTAASTLDIAKL
eukprot:COSAG02_NODE_8823_length_2431_cov_2.855060_2_plen_73_part_00